MISKGCIYHIVTIRNVDSQSRTLEFVTIMNKFLNVFPDDLPYIPLKKKSRLRHIFPSWYPTYFLSFLLNGPDNINGVEGLVERFVRKGFHQAKHVTMKCSCVVCKKEGSITLDVYRLPVIKHGDYKEWFVWLVVRGYSFSKIDLHSYYH